MAVISLIRKSELIKTDMNRISTLIALAMTCTAMLTASCGNADARNEDKTQKKEKTQVFIYMFRSMLGSSFMYLYAGVLLIVGCLFISKIKIKKPSMKVMIGFILIGVIELVLIITIRKLL